MELYCLHNNIPSWLVRADTVSENGPIPAEVSAAICTDTEEYFFIPT